MKDTEIVKILLDIQGRLERLESLETPATGGAATPATTGAMTVSMTTPVITITPTAACTFNASGGVAGATCTFVVTTAGTTSYILTWGSAFKTTGTLATGTVPGAVFTVSFVYDGVNWNETGRTTAM